MAINLKLNNKQNPSDLICFNTCPNILTITSDGSATLEKAQINIANLKATAPDKESTVIFNGYSITGVDDKERVRGRNFYRNGTSSTIQYCAISIINAFKSIPQLAMNYNFIFTSPGIIDITAKHEGTRFKIEILHNNLTNFNLTVTHGTDSDSLAGTRSSRIYCDVYYNNKDTQRKINGSDVNEYDYIATLQKEYYRNTLSFNISPILNSVSSNTTTEFKTKIYAIVDDRYVDIGQIDNNYIIDGYLVNQGNTYLNLNSSTYGYNVFPALNVSRGDKTKTTYNKSTLYVYSPTIDISLYKVGTTNTENITVKYLESDETLLDGYEGDKVTLDLSDKNIDTYTITLDEEKMRNSYYIDLECSFGVLRYTLINPPYANAECNRVYWNNSYGGVSFFDFTGEKKNNRTTEVTTYNKTLLDYYTNDKQEQEIIYFRENKLDVKLTSQLMDEAGLYQLYDLQNSYRAWITVNNVEYYIIIKGIEINEVNDNIYTVTIKYNYSLLDSFS